MGLENLWGIDISEGMISRAKSQFPAIAFRVMDCERLEFPDESFDLVAGWAILHHCNRSAALSEVARVLKPGGSAVFWEPLGHNPFLALARSLSPGARTQYERPLTVPDLERLGDHFREVKVSEFVLLPILFAPFRFIIGERPFARVLKHLVRGDEWIRAHLTWMRRHYWSVVIEVEK
jgi:SAM-dependent methyltransferase